MKDDSRGVAARGYEEETMKASWAILGGLAWSASEYAIHRFVGHGPRLVPPTTLRERLSPRGLMAAFNAEHVAHHTDTTYFAATRHKAIAACVAAPLTFAVVAPFAGVGRAASFTAGFVAVYTGYEVAHRLVHTNAPRTAYGRWMRRHHLSHHHRSPRANHGVTSALWDHVVGTHQPHERVKIPRSAAPVWLVDPATQDVRAEYAADYELVGRPGTESSAPRRARPKGAEPVAAAVEA